MTPSTARRIGVLTRVLAWAVTVVSLLYTLLGLALLVQAPRTARFLALFAAAGVEEAQGFDSLTWQRGATANALLFAGLGLLGSVTGFGLIQRRRWAPPALVTLAGVLLILSSYFWALLRTSDQVAQVVLATVLLGVCSWLAHQSGRAA